MINIYGIFLGDVLIYVGQTCKSVTDRFAIHKATAISRPRACPKLYAKMNKYGHDRFDARLLRAVPIDAADATEIALIAEHRLIDHGCNVAIGGRVNRGMKKTEEQRQQSSEIGKDRYSRGLGLASWNGSDAQKKMLSSKLEGRTIHWGDTITEAKSDGPYVITLNGHEFITLSINKFAKEHGLNTATLRNSLWNNKTCHSKGHIVNVRRA